jgi:hypothetical protein
MDTSKFNLWRACFSFCFVDGFLDAKENEWIMSKIDSLPFSADQIATLKKDLKSPPDIDNLLPLITKPADRGFLVNHVRMLATLDNQVSDSEKKEIQDIYKQVMSKVDLPALNNQIAEDEKASYHEDEVYKVHNKSSFIEKVYKGLLKKLNPGDYKFPEE